MSRRNRTTSSTSWSLNSGRQQSTLGLGPVSHPRRHHTSGFHDRATVPQPTQQQLQSRVVLVDPRGAAIRRLTPAALQHEGQMLAVRLDSDLCVQLNPSSSRARTVPAFHKQVPASRRWAGTTRPHAVPTCRTPLCAVQALQRPVPINGLTGTPAPSHRDTPAARSRHRVA